MLVTMLMPLLIPVLIELLCLVAPHSSGCGAICSGYVVFWLSTTIASWDSKTSLEADHPEEADYPAFADHRVFHDDFSSNAACGYCWIQLS